MYDNSVFNLVHFCQGKRSIFPWLVNISKSAYLLTIEHTILNTAFPMINYFFINTVCQWPFWSQTEIRTEEESLKGIQSITITFWDGSHYACLDGLELTLWTRLALNLQRDPPAPVSPSAGIKGVLPPCLGYSFIFFNTREQINKSKSVDCKVMNEAISCGWLDQPGRKRWSNHTKGQEKGLVRTGTVQYFSMIRAAGGRKWCGHRQAAMEGATAYFVLFFLAWEAPKAFGMTFTLFEPSCLIPDLHRLGSKDSIQHQEP